MDETRQAEEGKKVGGRPRALDDGFKRGQIVALLSAGANRRVAAEYVGVHFDTLRRTLERDPEFFAEVQQAEAKFETGMVLNVGKAAKDTRYWRAAVWNLESRHPERYRRRMPDTVTIEELQTVIGSFAKILMGSLPRGSDRRRVLKRSKRLCESLGVRLAKKRVRKEVVAATEAAEREVERANRERPPANGDDEETPNDAHER